MLTHRIRNVTVRNLLRYRGAPPSAVKNRLEQLDREWDVERAVALGAAALVVAGGVLLLQYTLQGWCPAVPLLRRLGFRTRNEIEAERRTLRRMLQQG